MAAKNPALPSQVYITSQVHNHDAHEWVKQAHTQYKKHQLRPRTFKRAYDVKCDNKRS